MTSEKKDPRVCPECNRPFRFGHEKCLWCGADLPLDETSNVKPRCPACGTELRLEVEGDLRIYFCQSCCGVFLTLPALKKFERLFEEVSPILPIGKKPEPTAGLDGLPDRGQPVTPRNCPVCGKHMARRRYQQVSNFVVDECMAHGTWFDPGEFELAIGFLRQGGLERNEAARDQFVAKTRESSDSSRKVPDDLVAPLNTIGTFLSMVTLF